MNIIERYIEWEERKLANGRARSVPSAPLSAERTPLTTNQHILHLLLSVFTGGLWLPVWIVRAWRGNLAPDGIR